MDKIKLVTGARAELVIISEFLLAQGFTPTYGFEAPNWKDSPIGVHATGRGWYLMKCDEEWRSEEPIPRSLIEDNFEVSGRLLLLEFPDHPEVGIAIRSAAAAAASCRITSQPWQRHFAKSDHKFERPVYK